MIAREDRGPIAVLRLAHGKVNAIDPALCERVLAELEGIRDSDVDAIVIAGSGSAFSAGVDLFQVVNGGGEYVQRFLPAMDAMFRAVLTFPKPVVAAVNGHAIAGGCILAAACDFRLIAGGNARMGIPELAVGVPFPALPLEIVAARVNPASIRELVYGARTVLPDEAVALGLADQTCPAEELMPRAVQKAESLAGIPRRAFALTKQAFVQPILDRVDALKTHDTLVSAIWSDQQTFQAIRSYLDRTVGRK